MKPVQNLVLVSLIAALPCVTAATEQSPSVVDPARATWFEPPTLRGVSGAWLLGGEDEVGIYQLRVKLAPDTWIAPHTHPDTRNSTVLQGTLWVGFGDRVDKATMVPVPAGSLYVAPANQPHYLWAKDGAVEYQESGVGPSATVPLPGEQ